MATRIQLKCAGCERTPDQILDYCICAEDEGVSPDTYVWCEEGTLNRDTGLFLCDSCYFKAGMPSGPQGWVVPDYRVP